MIHYVCGPFRVERMKLCVRTEIAGQSTFTPFEQDIIWGRHSESTISFFHGGRLFREGPTFNDYYGFMTSEKSAIEEAKRLAKVYEITKESSLVIEVKTKVFDTPYWRSPRCEKTDLNDDRVRHQLEAVYDQKWLKEENGSKLESVELSSTITWNSRTEKLWAFTR